MGRDLVEWDINLSPKRDAGRDQRDEQRDQGKTRNPATAQFARGMSVSYTHLTLPTICSV